MPRPRLTKAAVVHAMQAAGAPLSVYDLAGALSRVFCRKVAVNSVYRILTALDGEGLARRVATKREWMLRTLPAGQEELLLLCNQCDRVSVVPAPPQVVALHERGRALGFEPDRLLIEVIGRCTDCQAETARSN